MVPLRDKSPLLKLVKGRVIELPSPLRIRSWWNFGSLLGVCLVFQIITGLILAMHYVRDVEGAFRRVRVIMREVNYGWVFRVAHANGARMMFVCLYLHVGRGIYYSSFKFLETWMIGVTILVLGMATAFLGYVLPWGQMSFWGATVITNLLRAIPWVGEDVVNWVWGGFAVGYPTLVRFFSLHFLIPFVIAGISGVHLIFLHETGSRNPLGVRSDYRKIRFHPYFVYKDVFGFLVMYILMGWIVGFVPWDLGDPENFIKANPLVTPEHIQPEWYFLFAYAILRSIPNKLGGVMALLASVVVLWLVPGLGVRNNFNFLGKLLFWVQVVIFLLLTWIGACPVEAPYIFIGQILTCVYFLFFMIYGLSREVWESII